MANNYFRKYWRLRVEGAMARLQAVLEIIAHNPTRGAQAETTLRTLLAEFLPNRWGSGGGFILERSGRISRQVDILLYDQMSVSPIYRDGPLVVLSPKMVRVAIEVKSNLDGEAIKEALQNIETVKRTDPTALGIVFGYRGAKPDTLRKHLRKRIQEEKTAGTFEKKCLPDAIYVLERNIVIDRAVKPAGCYDGYSAGDPVIKHLFTRVLSKLIFEFIRFAHSSPLNAL